MASEPRIKRAVSFIDGQNLYRNAKSAFGHHHPNYDPLKLGVAVCDAHGWKSCGVRFYTDTPAADRSPMWHGYWERRLLSMRRAGVTVFSRPIRYRTREVPLPTGEVVEGEVGQEKGIDLRLGLDVVRLASQGELDVAVIFSQDQDFAEVADEIRAISRSQDRWLKVVSAFPWASQSANRRGINKTDWFGIEQSVYDACLDDRDYRPRQR